MTTARANQTTGLTNGRVVNWAPEVEFSPFRALSRRQMTFPFCCYINLLFKADVSKTPTRGRDRSWSLLYFRFIFFCFLQIKTWSRRTKHNINGPRPNPCPHPFPSPPQKCKFGVMTLSEGRDRYAVSPESYPSRVLSYPFLRTE